MSLEIPSTGFGKAHRKRSAYTDVGDAAPSGRSGEDEKVPACCANHITRGCVSEVVLHTDWRLPLNMGALFSSSTRLICGFFSCCLR